MHTMQLKSDEKCFNTKRIRSLVVDSFECATWHQ